ncbi:type III-B CRISPR-associated protein Cas10/Cmr2 [Rappaport israeli]|uniref:type III-B CRISPR-associated protein Cas10/Cmr2 n=1 Tax=Rappaport israeli TaxID=1839807 RepID=UPI000A88A692|nr:type III-B CRISPR-associated protein Cas10/Cmr2 [Rappaport israeli]
MTEYLITFSVGPVQTMIAAARRSRDLWSGSWLLSELAKACAKSLKTQGADLIFPFVQDEALLKENSTFSVGNKIQAVVKVDNQDALPIIINNAKTATQARFRREAERVFEDLGHYKNQLRQEIWNKQIDDYLEIQVAWAKIADNANGYQQAVEKVGKVLASRKATRDFNANINCPYDNDYMLLKSSLDGMRETVLQEKERLKIGLRQKLSLSQAEQLDLIGVVKRLGFDEKAEQFTPFSRITAHAWLNDVFNDNAKALADIEACYKELVKLGVTTRVTGNDKTYANFAYDAQLLYPSRLERTIIENNDLKKEDANQALLIENALKALQTALRPLWRQYGEPCPYGVLLQADGDRMGELLDKATTQEQHQAITEALSKFASQVADTMKKYSGHCIYAGGDDVLGFVPLNQAVDCSEALQVLFKDKLSQVANELKAENPPTLSVGLAICHLMTPFGVIRELALAAEKHAKGDHIDKTDDKEQRRNALGVLLSVRGGSQIKLRYRWDDEQGLAEFKKSSKMVSK